MIEAKELREGNYYLDRGGKAIRCDFIESTVGKGEYKICQEMFLNGVEVHPLTEYTSKANPIPLTEDWLLKFDFEIPINASWAMLDGFELDFRGGVIRYAIFKIKDVDHIHLKYVHQLQNLYFVLTGKELQLKESKN